MQKVQNSDLPKAVLPRRERRSQVDRSNETRKKLCEAALQLLSEIGYERVTTALIAQRAEVSKGAQTHHFPTKADVLVGAFEHLLKDWKTRREAFLERHGSEASLDLTLHYLWREVFSRADYIAAIELMLAARHDAPLRSRLQELLAAWTVARDDMFRRVVGLDGDVEATSSFLQLNFCVLRGMAIYDSLSPRPGNDQDVLNLWLSMAKKHFESANRTSIERGSQHQAKTRPKKTVPLQKR